MIVFLHHVSEQSVVRAHLGIRITHQNHNVTFIKTPLECIELRIENLLPCILHTKKSINVINLHAQTKYRILVRIYQIIYSLKIKKNH